MKRIFTSLLFISCFGNCVSSQANDVAFYKKSTQMIAMRDGVKLFTVILKPVDSKQAYPILIVRTPYGADLPVANDSAFETNEIRFYNNMAKEGYIFVFQDIRGKYKSEGAMQIHQPLIHNQQKGAVDESTDTWDMVDWLVKNVSGNNGKAGITGISYPGWLFMVSRY